ncbi:hypothetical protein B0H17DRAFT_1139839 [Mycena rosella]|uniref:Uncharacterized protein n=1 Tax=Mycena rosella TaxID=1033263 RepID=A0AAD7D3A8_MYCRO|nr:hypothetical protein B0H17DRAFT_1139839 [Mycena rosella]
MASAFILFTVFALNLASDVANHEYLSLPSVEDLAALRAIGKNLLTTGIRIHGYHFDAGRCGVHVSCPGVVRSTITDSSWIAPFYERGWGSTPDETFEKVGIVSCLGAHGYISGLSGLKMIKVKMIKVVDTCSRELHLENSWSARFISNEAVALSNTRMQYHWKDMVDGVIVTGVNSISSKGLRVEFLLFGEVDCQTNNTLYLKRPSLNLADELELELCLAFDRQLPNIAGALLTQDRPFGFTCGEFCVTTSGAAEIAAGSLSFRQGHDENAP